MFRLTQSGKYRTIGYVFGKRKRRIYTAPSSHIIFMGVWRRQFMFFLIQQSVVQ
jgi:hypothetical protein